MIKTAKQNRSRSLVPLTCQWLRKEHECSLTLHACYLKKKRQNTDAARPLRAPEATFAHLGSGLRAAALRREQPRRAPGGSIPSAAARRGDAGPARRGAARDSAGIGGAARPSPEPGRPARRPCQRGAAGRTGPYPSPRERHAPPGASATSPPVPRAPQPRPCCTPAPSDLRPTATLPGTSPPDPAAAPRAAAAAANHGRRTAKRGPWRRRLLPVTARLRPPLDDGRAVPAARC